MTMHELNEAATLSRRDLDVSNFAESLEKRAKLVLSNVARETTNEDGGVVRVGELIHGLHGVEWTLIEIRRDTPHGSASMSGNGTHHGIATMALSILM
jgi:hypothetical protein